MSRLRVPAALAALLACGAWQQVSAAAPPVGAFAHPPRIGEVTISPDGRYLSYITATAKGQAVVIQDRAAGAGAPYAVLSASDGLSLLWCRWPTGTRLLCAVLVPRADAKGVVTTATRLVGVDPDGKNVKVLVEEFEEPGEQLLDDILAWSVDGVPDAVLYVTRQLPTQRVLSDTRAHSVQDLSTAPTVYTLDIHTGERKVRVPAHEPLQKFLADGQGEVRLGWGAPAPAGFGPPGPTVFQARDPGTGDWHTLSLPPSLSPVALCAGGAGCAYAIGPSDGRDALWRIDLTGKAAPAVEFAHPAVDVSEPFIARDGHLFGVRYDTEQPLAYYTDAAAGHIVENLKKLLPDALITLSTYTSDGRQMIIHSTSDVDAGTWYLFDVEKNTIARLGTAYPELTAQNAGRMRAISFPARDGTAIPGFLTTPDGGSQHLPLVVLAHGSTPGARDLRQFDLLRAFLVSRGYAVLQVNARGSSGYGAKWMGDAKGDQGGLPYTDILDGVRWAVGQGTADPQRVAIVGRGYGGYEALLGAWHNGDVFHCAVSVGGYSDLSPQAMGSGGGFGGFGGPSPPSPRQHAADLRVPVLLVHGDHDASVNVEQSKAMDAALTAANKPHRFVLLAGADHDFTIESDRSSMLTAVETFLAENLGKGAP